MRRKQFVIVSSAVLAACALTWDSAHAAPGAYQTAVTADSPYAYYRLGEDPVSNGTVAADASGNARPGTFVIGASGPVTSGVAGSGVGSDTAVTFPGTGTGATGSYLGAPNVRNLGALLGTSSFEFVFKVNPGFSTTTKQSLFGVFNTGSSTAAEVTLNSQGNDALGAFANTTRLFIRGDDGDAVGVHFVNPGLYDGNYHHLTYTYDTNQSGIAAFAAYVDGVSQPLTLQQVGTGAADADTDPDTFSNFAFDPTFAARDVRGALGTTAITQLANITLDEASLYSSVLSPTQTANHAAATGIPEPASLALLGGAGLALMRRGRRRPL